MSEGAIAIGKSLIISIFLGAAVVASSVIAANGFDKLDLTVRPDRTVTVRGLAEREVDADMAVWRMSYNLGGETLQEVQASIIAKNNVAIEYLKKYGLTDTDYTIQAPDITDTTLRLYGSDSPAKYHFIAKQSLLIRSKNVQAVKSAQEHVLDLLSQDVTIDQEYGTNVEYEYTALNSIKPEMIGEATKNARSAAEQFAGDSGSTVGKIKNATQGFFSIESAATGLEQRKKIRVVTTVEYILTD